MKKTEWLWILALGLLLVGGWLVLKQAPEGSSLEYAPQEIAGSALRLVSLTTQQGVFQADIKQAGFVTVHQAVGAAPGPIMGVSSLLQPGDDQQVIVTMDGAIPGNDYIALLFVDDGDGIYEPRIDLPVQSEGVVVRVDAKATAND